MAYLDPAARLSRAAGLRLSAQWSPRPLPFRALAMLLLAATTIIVRAPNFGHPSFHIDEQFYLLVGQEILDGAMPYVDIWDRKPLGLFLIYAAMAALGSTGIETYQAFAAVSVFSTATVIALSARLAAGPVAALSTGILYIVMLEPLAGGGGQAPIFYNLPVAFAFFMVLRAQQASLRSALWGGAAAMLACGLAIFMKPTALFESASFGLMLLWLLAAKGQSRKHGLVTAFVFALLCIAPTALSFLLYSLAGHGAEIWFATVESNLLKAPLQGQAAWRPFAHLFAVSFPFVAVAVAGLALSPWRGLSAQARQVRLTALWLVGALAGFLSVPNFFDHYALPLVAPLALAALPLFQRGIAGILAWSTPVVYALLVTGFPAYSKTERAISESAELAATVKVHLRGGCLYIFDGPPYLYDLAGACRLTRYVFPEHLNLARESNAIGVDTAAEMRRILAARPSVVVRTAAPQVGPPNAVTTRLLSEALLAQYKMVARVPYQSLGRTIKLEVWARTRSETAPKT